MSSQKRLTRIIPLLLTSACTTASEEPPEVTSQTLAPVRSTVAELRGEAASPEIAASDYATKQLPNLGPLAGWRVRKSRLAPTGNRSSPSRLDSAGAPVHIVRMTQLHAGLPVFGGDVVVHLDDTQALRMTGNVAAELEWLDVAPRVAAAKMVDAAKRAYLARVINKTDTLLYDRESTELVILPADGTRSARLAWHVIFHTELQGGVEPGLWNSFYDAHTGELLLHFNDIKFYSEAFGYGRGTRQWPSLNVDPHGQSGYAMITPRLETYDLNNATGGGNIITGTLSNFGFPAANDAHGFAEVTDDMMGWWGLPIDLDDVIESKVRYGNLYGNAFWDGARVNYGEVTLNTSLSSDLNVVAHEINHAYTDEASGLNGTPGPAAIDESFSDVAAEIAESYHKSAAPDFLTDTEVSRRFIGSRNLCTPSADGSSIDHASAFTISLAPHHAAGFMNRAFCRAVRRFATGSPTGAATPASVKEIAFAWYYANLAFWTSSSTFQQACQGILDAAVLAGYTQAQYELIRRSWDDVGVTCGSPVKQNVLYVDANQHIREIQGSSPTWSTNVDLTTAAGSVPVVGSPFGYAQRAKQHIVFRDGNGHIRKLDYDGTTWTSLDLTVLSGSTAVAASDPTGMMDFSAELVFFRDTNNQIHMLKGFGAASWTDTNLTATIPGSAAAKGKPFAYKTGFDLHVVFRGTNDDVHELYYSNFYWVDNNLTVHTGGRKAASDPMGYTKGNTQHIIFKGTDNDLHELYNNGAFWVDNNLTLHVNGTQLAGAPFGFSTPAAQHIFFKGIDGTLRELYNNGAWSENNLTALAGAVPPDGDPTGSYSASYHVVYRGTDGYVHELGSDNTPWTDKNLNALVGGPAPATSSAFVYVTN